MKWSLILVLLVVGCTSGTSPHTLLEDLSNLASVAEEEPMVATLDVPEGVYDYSNIKTSKTWAVVFKHKGIVYSQSSEHAILFDPYTLLETPGRKTVTVSLNGTEVLIQE